MKQKTIGEIKAELKAAEESMLPVFIENYKEDTRSGVQAAVALGKKTNRKIRGREGAHRGLKKIRIRVCRIYLYLWDR